jgi:hypothetical protein
MKTTKIIGSAWGLFLVGLIFTARAQSTITYQITPFDSTDSLVTWNVTGSLLGPSGVLWEDSAGNFGGLPLVTTGLFVSGYTGTSSPQSIPTPDGSYFHNTELAQNFSIDLYFAAPIGGNDNFALITSPATTATGQHLTYNAGSQSVVLPIPYADFNPGSYQSSFAPGTFFDSALTVNLNVVPVPEPGALPLTGLVALSLFLFRCWRR